ncbi:MAG: hypothetical protein CMN56_04555 [Sneathiella sp.]|uniref:hypothetical protein n=1 Tax=Sneathiella sp. TaxID=1964365 RepID=UPI000C3BB54E|nr:hypothetical protein [Sneathiella sp.]MAZ02388.1 hypothetical protein [Sneathiella sp.]
MATSPDSPGDPTLNTGFLRYLPEKFSRGILSLQGILLISMCLASGFQGIFGLTWLKFPILAGMILFSLLVAISGSRVIRIFLVLGLLCFPLTFQYAEDVWHTLNEGAVRAQLFMSFITAIMVLREPAFRSQLLQAAGNIIVRQRQGRRVLMLLMGSHLFGLMMNMGSVVLLSSIASSRDREKGATGHSIAQRQSALAIVHGFVATMMWSPLSLALVVVLSQVQGVTSSMITPLGLLGVLFFLALSFAVSQLEVRLRRHRPELASTEQEETEMRGGASFLKILMRVILLVVVIFSTITAVSLGASVSVPVAVTLAIPLITFVWLMIQAHGDLGICLRGPLANTIFRTLPSQSSEVGILLVAGFMGPVLVALMPTADINAFLHSHHTPPGVIVLVAFFAIVAGGVVAINPLISVTIVLGVLADPTALGIHPLYLALSILGAWVVGSSLSPYTSVTIVTASMFGVKSTTLALVWNRLFGAIALTVCAGLIFIFGELTAIPIP